jgi:hypothetical protein
LVLFGPAKPVCPGPSRRRDKYGAGQARWLSSAFERSIDKTTGGFERGFYTHFGGI